MDALNETLAAAINKAVNAAESGVAFLSAELPDYIQQLLLYHGVLSFLIWFFCLAFILSQLWIIPNIVKHANENRRSDEWPAPNIVTLIMLFFADMVVIPCFLYNFSTWLQITIAPKVFLVEYATKLVS